MVALVALGFSAVFDQACGAVRAPRLLPGSWNLRPWALQQNVTGCARPWRCAGALLGVRDDEPRVRLHLLQPHDPHLGVPGARLEGGLGSSRLSKRHGHTTSFSQHARHTRRPSLAAIPQLTVVPNPRPGCYDRRFPEVPDTVWEFVLVGYSK